MALIWLPNESDPAAQIKVVRAAALMNFLPLVIKAACLRGMINGPQRSCRPSASIPANAVARKLTEPSAGLGPSGAATYPARERGDREPGAGTGTGVGPDRDRATGTQSCGKGPVEGLGHQLQPPVAALCQGRGAGRRRRGLVGADGGYWWQVGCWGQSGVSHSIATEAWEPRPVSSPSAWGPRAESQQGTTDPQAWGPRPVPSAAQSLDPAWQEGTPGS